MINFSDLPLNPDSARAARNYFGLNQQQAADESSLPVHKIKRFETGNHIPDTKFLENLKAFYEGKGYSFPDTAKPGTKAKANGKVFPAGVVQSDDEGEAEAAIGKPLFSQVQHIRIDPSLNEDEVGRIFDHIEHNEEVISAILRKKVETGLFDRFSDACEATHGKALRLLAENGTLLAKLFGRPLIDTPSPKLAGVDTKPHTHAELLARTQTQMHGAIKGDKEAIAKHKADKAPRTLTEAIFG
jgi:hypothetical protein